MDYDFAVSTKDIESLITTLNEKITEIGNVIDELFDTGDFPINKLDTMEVWSGASYKALRDGTEQGAKFVHDNLDKAKEMLENYVKVLEAAKTAGTFSSSGAGGHGGANR